MIRQINIYFDDNNLKDKEAMLQKIQYFCSKHKDAEVIFSECGNETEPSLRRVTIFYEED